MNSYQFNKSQCHVSIGVTNQTKYTNAKSWYTTIPSHDTLLWQLPGAYIREEDPHHDQEHSYNNTVKIGGHHLAEVGDLLWNPDIPSYNHMSELELRARDLAEKHCKPVGCKLVNCLSHGGRIDCSGFRYRFDKCI